MPKANQAKRATSTARVYADDLPRIAGFVGTLGRTTADVISEALDRLAREKPSSPGEARR